MKSPSRFDYHAKHPRQRGTGYSDKLFAVFFFKYIEIDVIVSMLLSTNSHAFQ